MIFKETPKDRRPPCILRRYSIISGHVFKSSSYWQYAKQSELANTNNTINPHGLTIFYIKNES